MHTPGPWTVHQSAGPVTNWISDGKGKHFLNIRNVSDAPQTRVESDARLISAAPDLLAALQEFIAAVDYGESHHAFRDELKQAHAAISKAEGRSRV